MISVAVSDVFCRILSCCSIRENRSEKLATIFYYLRKMLKFSVFYLVLTHISRLDVVCCLVPAQFITSHQAVVLIVLLPNLILTRSTAC